MNDNLFPIVGIGASAGGLEAFTQLLRNLPNDTGMGFVLIQHLAPYTKSLLSEILGRITQMPVLEVTDGMSVEQNHVYVIPPNKKMVISQGVLKLTPREYTNGKHMPVDSLFFSLASDRGSKAIGVVLSGGDGDGTLGLETIKAEGGITFAQSEESAKVDSMPHTAAATGIVDFILPPEEIALEIVRISHHAYITPPTPTKTAIEVLPVEEDNLLKIFTMLGTATGVDFTYYKEPTLLRRVERRMVVHKLSSLEDYVSYLQDNPTEVAALFKDVLIHVTSFFRDPEAFEALKSEVFPRFMLNKSPTEPIRIWVPGCSTGEEVYSIAICLVEFLEDLSQAEEEGLPPDSIAPNASGAGERKKPKYKTAIPSIKIFATDISDTAIEKARAGIYTTSQTLNVEPERLQRFFIQVEDGYSISKRIRELCIFAKQNLSQDPPFYNLDLISCRNVLIYLKPALQKQAMQIFNYSLNLTGCLLLGTSESPGEFSELFTPLDKKSKIYSKKMTPTRLNFDFIASNYPVGKVKHNKKINPDIDLVHDIQKEADQIVLNKYAPVGVIINDDMEIFQFRGETSPYLRPAPGKPSFNLLKMAHQALLLDLHSAIHRAKEQNVPAIESGLVFPYNDQFREVTIEVIPFNLPSTNERFFLVLFEDVTPSDITKYQQSKSTTGNGNHPDAELEIIQLRQELAAKKHELAGMKQYLQSVIDEHETTNQELKAANEEILSSNEEFQSTNEELETAKEEIQATNEELNTINEDLRCRNLELNQLNDDLNNLIGSANLPILILSRDLIIRRFTPMAEKVLKLIPTDIGRSLSQIRSNLKLDNLEELVLEVINTVTVKTQEVQGIDDHWYDMRIRPYTTTENCIDGAVIVLVDIEELKQSEQQLKAARDYSESMVRTVRHPLVVVDADLKVKTANPAFYQTFRVNPFFTEQHSIFELGNGQWNIPALHELLSEVIPKDREIQNFEVNHAFEEIGLKTILLNACKIPQEGDEIKLMLLAIEDITERKQLEDERTQLLSQEQSARAEAEAANLAKDEFLSVLSHELRTPLAAMLMWAQLLRTRKFDDAKTTRALEMIERSAKSQNQLIEELLDVSRITTGKLHLKPCSIDLGNVIQAAIDIIRLAAEAKNIKIEYIPNPTLGKIWGDPHRLQQVMWNLLSNAIKFTPNGGRVEVQLKRIDDYACVRVRDTGSGISAEFLPFVFERFRQADSTSTRSHGGLGLGLTIVRHLVELHGGNVRAESLGEGQGTTMIVRLPLQAIPSAVSPSRGEPLAPTSRLSVTLSEPPTLRGLRVLVVDDDAQMLEVLKTALGHYGAEVTAHASAHEAMAALTASAGMYDVLLSDIAMPEEDGYAFIRQVRAMGAELGGDIPAAALTAYVRNEDRDEALSAGFQMHIGKPIEPEQLAFSVASLAGIHCHER